MYGSGGLLGDLALGRRQQGAAATCKAVTVGIWRSLPNLRPS